MTEETGAVIYCTHEDIDPTEADGSFEKPFTMQQAIDKARQGDELRILNPLYKEPETMTDVQKYIELKNAVGEWIRLDDLETDAAFEMTESEDTVVTFEQANIAASAARECVRRIYKEII